ncbi:hypothetical protein [Parvularcula maris]|uniref:Lipoprotein n=1 Tax=Parvularcula maris TaxID=2965077 RepID=A0A9X2L795_9PROT|nr:hypothetical protein [Parvularcula maris]MCQ8184256.1 hypothetical protein [Parvularcula maris]
MKRHLILASVAALAVTSCETIPDESMDVTSAADTGRTEVAAPASGQKQLVLVRERAPMFDERTPAAVAFQGGSIGSNISASRDAETRENGIIHAGALVEDLLQEPLAAKYGAVPADENLDYSQSRKPRKLPEVHNTIYLDAQLRGWGYSYWPFNWTRFRVSTIMNVYVMDGSTGKPIDVVKCGLMFSADKPSEGDKLGDLVADGGIVLRERLDGLAERCADKVLMELNAEG